MIIIRITKKVVYIKLKSEMTQDNIWVILISFQKLSGYKCNRIETGSWPVSVAFIPKFVYNDTRG